MVVRGREWGWEKWVKEVQRYQNLKKKKKKKHFEENRQDIPGGPMVKTPCFLPPARTRSCSQNPTSQTSSAEGGHSVPGWGTKSLHAHGVAEKKKKIVYKGKQADSPLTRG